MRPLLKCIDYNFNRRLISFMETDMWRIYQETTKHVMLLDLDAIGRSIAVVFLSEYK